MFISDPVLRTNNISQRGHRDIHLRPQHTTPWSLAHSHSQIHVEHVVVARHACDLLDNSHIYCKLARLKISDKIHEPVENWAKIFQFSATRNCVSLPRSTTSGDWKCVLFVKFKSQHLSVFQDWKHILLLATGYAGANKYTEWPL